MTSPRYPRTTAGLLGASLCVVLAGCGASTASSGGSSTPGPTAQASSSTNGSGPGGSAVTRPVSGVISSVSGQSLSVQSSQGQSSSVIWTSSTTITDEVPGARSAVVKGACVSVRPQSTGRQRPWRLGLRLCVDGLRCPAIVRPHRTGDGDISDRDACRFLQRCRAWWPRPTAGHRVEHRPSLAADSTIELGAGQRAGGGYGGGAGGFGLSGTVTAVTPSSITLAVRSFQRPSGSASPSSAASARVTTRSLLVTTTGGTTYSIDSRGTAKNLLAGLCVTATGQQSASTLAARSLLVSQSVNGACTGGTRGSDWA